MNSQIFQNMLEQIPALAHHERVLLKNVLDMLDDHLKVCDIIDSRMDADHICPRCGSKHIHNHGTRAGIQRYKCVSCKRTFNSLTGTPLARLRKKDSWLSYLSGMLESVTIRKASAQLKINKKTAFLWRHRFSSWMCRSFPKELTGVVEVDETYYRLSHKGQRKLRYKSHKRGSDYAKRGLSKEKVCVLIACDRSQKELEFITGLGPVSGKWLDMVMKDRVAADAVLVTDGLSSYAHFSKLQHITHVVVKNEEGERVKGGFHIQHVNSYHSRLRDWIIGKFHGVATKYLNHYLWWRHQLENKSVRNPEDLFKLSMGIVPPLTGT